MIACGLLLAVLSAGANATAAPSPAPTPPAPVDPAGLLERAIRSAGGAARLERYPALAWRGRAVVHAGGREIAIEGDWRLVPPDHALVETREAGQGAGAVRRLLISGDRGWSERDGETRPLPPEFVTHERDQFYLYYLMRLVPLRSAGFRLAPLASDASGHAGLRVSRDGHRDVDLYFDDAPGLARLVTRIADPKTGKEVLEEVRCEGAIESRGIRWPKRLVITWDGQPYFDLDLLELRPERRLDESIFEPAD